MMETRLYVATIPQETENSWNRHSSTLFFPEFAQCCYTHTYQGHIQNKIIDAQRKYHEIVKRLLKSFVADDNENDIDQCTRPWRHY
jgi:hypothetical protein